MVEELEKYGVSPGPSRPGCLLLPFEYSSMESLQVLWKMYVTGELLTILQTGLITEYVLKECKVESIFLDIYISNYKFAELIQGNISNNCFILNSYGIEKVFSTFYTNKMTFFNCLST